MPRRKAWRIGKTKMGYFWHNARIKKCGGAHNMLAAVEQALMNLFLSSKSFLHFATV